MTHKVIPTQGPFLGIVDDLPSVNAPASAFSDVVNWLCRKNRVQTRPRLTPFPTPPDRAIVRNIVTFIDSTEQAHTLVLTTKNAYFLTEGATYNLLSYPVGITDLSGTALPYAIMLLNDRVYFSNGSKVLLYADGESSVKVAGNVPGSCRFMVVSASHLITAFTTVPA